MAHDSVVPLALIVYNLIVGNLCYESLRIRNEAEQARLDFIRTDLAACLTFASVSQAEHKRGNREHA
jgi:hypothetical protein